MSLFSSCIDGVRSASLHGDFIRLVNTAGINAAPAWTIIFSFDSLRLSSVDSLMRCESERLRGSAQPPSERPKPASV
ncbi:hypothetical protein AMELA_G00233510 [Ameiurus melas]|uniref:Uncharacterized protein n=1 Tax=Ameiurus melas TaxID=219545 RepID=A0A7J5ZXH9_AMEME|nr:hypothetical protein AMELA_G00233510 [Ameiurus melas]